MSHIHIVNGPNLNLLGRRSIDIYGTEPMESFLKSLSASYPEVNILYFQSNHEGKLIDYLHSKSVAQSQGLIINAAALSHTSRALPEALLELHIPMVEVHISNIYARESWRRCSFLSAHVDGVITGLGLRGYELALRHLLSLSQHPNE